MPPLESIQIEIGSALAWILVATITGAAAETLEPAYKVIAQTTAMTTRDQSEKLDRVIDAWATNNHVSFASELRSMLIDNTLTALREVARLHPETKAGQLQQIGERSVTRYLDASVRNSEIPSIADLMEEEITGSGLAFERLRPMAYVIVTSDPKDAEVFANGRSLGPADGARLGFLPEKITLEFRKQGYRPCVRTIVLRVEQDGTASCQLER
jgi:hypothetical protein